MRWLVFLFICLVPFTASGKDLGQWGDTDLVTREWYKHLMQPDAPTASCCGEADAYEADDFETDEGENSLGPSSIRGVAQQLKERHPEVKEVHGYRVSGAKAARGPAVKVKI